MWFTGDVAEAVEKTKTDNACLLVFIEGNDENSKRLENILHEDGIQKYLQNTKFVCIRIHQDSMNYMHFASIYQIVPVPSIFFLNKDGAPQEICTSLLETAQELEVKIKMLLNVLSASETTSTTSETNIAAATAEVESICTTTTQTANVSTVNVPQKQEEESEQLSNTNKEAEDKEDKEAKEREKHLRELCEILRRNKMNEQAARERVRAQIAADRRERTEYKNVENNDTTASPASASNEPTTVSMDTNVVRLQFRMSNGTRTTHNFESNTQLRIVRDYVRTELVSNSADFIMVTSYPKNGLDTDCDDKTLLELGLHPSAVILVIIKQSATSPAAIRRRFDGILSIGSNVFWILISPLLNVANYLGHLVGWRSQSNRSVNEAQTKKNDDNDNDAAMLAAQRRTAAAAAADKFTGTTSFDDNTTRRRWGDQTNVHRINEQRDDDNEDNATWNGNSTQQQ